MPNDLLDRDFTAPAPNRRWVADFTYCRTWSGVTYVAFVVDVYAQRIVGWHAATDRRTDLVLTPLRIALWDRERRGAPIEPGQLLHHSDAGSQGGFKWLSQHLDREVERWEQPHGRSGSVRTEDRSRHRDGLRSRGGRIELRSGRRSLAA